MELKQIKCSKCKRSYPEDLMTGNGWCDHCQEDYDEWSREMLDGDRRAMQEKQ
jgi:hypothetical protein